MQCLAVLILAAMLRGVSAAKNPPTLTAEHKVFYVGGHYAGGPGQTVMTGQMFVEEVSPIKVTHPYPIILIHGFAQTAVNWLEPPDGREGWADWLTASWGTLT